MYFVVSNPNQDNDFGYFVALWIGEIISSVGSFVETILVVGGGL
jgi:hypothetical protein